MAVTTDPWVRWDWVSNHGDDIAAATRQHVELTLIAVLLGLVLSFPLALAARRWRVLQTPILSVTGILYTIPSLALFAMLVPWTGLSRTTSEIGLVSYTLLILVRNTVTGLDGVPPDVVEAARGMGFSQARLLLRIELPLALPGILTGLRLATVSTVALVTVGALIGKGGLGDMILGGFRNNFYKAQIMTASILCVLLALVLDLVLAGIGRALTPWTRERRS